MSKYRAKSTNIEFQSELHKKIDEKSSIIFGVNIDSRKSLGSPSSYAVYFDNNATQPLRNVAVDASDIYNSYSAFAQYKQELDILKGLIIAVGVRYDYGTVDISQKRTIM